MNISDEYVGTYVGLNDTGEVVQYFDDPENFGEAIDSVVSVGYVQARVTEYIETYSIPKADSGEPTKKPVDSKGCGTKGPYGFFCTHHENNFHVARDDVGGALLETWPIVEAD